ncbi:MAG: hypothetical protein ACREF9_00445 [Opitutaceae bacterium]
MTPRRATPSAHSCVARRVAAPCTRRSLASHNNPAGGFALLITITLLAFVVVLLLGLAVYTRVETSVAGNMQRQSQARENALLGLNVALAQLQKHAGLDTRITATGANFGAIDGTHHYTGVWSNDVTNTAPLTWLVSGNEIARPDIPDPDPNAPQGSMIPAPLAVTPLAPGTRLQTLVGRNSTGDLTRGPSWVDAPLVDVTATGGPGVAPSAPPAVIGRYAWWVGDQGVKAPVAVADTTNAIAYLPFDTPELNRRIRQQFALGAGAAEAGSGDPLFESGDSNNVNLVADQKISAASQFAFLRTPSNAQVGFVRVQRNFHALSPNNLAVLANTKLGGLRQDLSLEPTLLGAAFAAWANYPAYMEKFRPDPVLPPDPNAPPPTTPTTPTILPAYGDDPIRRRYTMTPHFVDPSSGGSHQIAPVLSYFFITFNVRTLNGSTAANPLEVRAGWMLSLWNPYTGSLVPENLRVEVRGLPSTVAVVNDTPARAGPIGSFSLQASSGQAVFDAPLQISLPWDSINLPANAPAEDRQSWLPGRVYTWRSIEDSGTSVPPDGFASKFYSRNFGDDGPNQGVRRTVNGGPAVDGSDACHLEISGNTELDIRIYVVRPGGDELLGRYTSPAFVDTFTTTSRQISAGTYQFGYEFRLAESIDTPTTPNDWLTTDGRDFRRRRVPPEAYVVGAQGNSPELYENTFSVAISKPDRLLDRGSDSWSYNEDVPIFELPRSPLLSLGALQHLRLTGRRPFMIGNPWGARERLNDIPLGELFDRFFFSGLAAGVVPATSPISDVILPNPLLKPLRKSDHSKVTVDDLNALMSPPVITDPDGNILPGPPPSSYSSKYFLQAGAFNLNSVNPAAWASVLRGVRFPAPQAFTYLDSSATTGTAEDMALASIQSSEAHFFRFPQSAQETYKAEPGLADNDPNTVSPANTHLFRRGMRTLSAAELSALATKIVALMGVKHAALAPEGGPFRSLDEFLAPSPLFAGVDANGNPLAPRSLLEAAIADAGINVTIPEFSSQWLTQADVMTALAPILFPRSDTFMIRTYGEAVNPVTNAVEGKAWAEALVQRLPEYFDASATPETPASAFEPVPDPNDPAAPPTSTPAQDLNKLYGRRFKVISFRWLTRSDI